MTEPRHRPPRRAPLAPWERETPRAELARLGLLVALGVAAAAFALYFLADVDIGRRKVDQKVERQLRDLLLAQASLQALAARDGAPPAPEDGALPVDFAARHAALHGGAPFHQEVGRLARLDLFAPSGPHREPLFYAVAGQSWVLASRGPDGAFGIPDGISERLGTASAEAWLKARTYDPTNGAASEGDLWVGWP